MKNFLAVALACAAQPAFADVTLRVNALIDGRSILQVQNNQVRWHHLDYAAPGLWAGNNAPTVLNGNNWFPNWSPYSGEVRCGGCYSNSFDLAGIGLHLGSAPALLSLEVVRARWSASVMTYPSVGNGYLTEIDLNDDPPGGADYYEVVLHFGSSDSSVPTTSASLSGTQGDPGWYRSAVTVTLSATDPDDSVASTSIALDGAAAAAYTGPVTVSAEGHHSISFFSTDSHGNAEKAKSASFVIDTTPPSITAGAAPSLLWPPNHKMVHVSIAVSASDNLDPAPTVALISATSSEPDDGIGDGHTMNDIQNLSFGAADLRAERSGTGSGRLYSIRYRATDKAGNTAESSAYVRVPHDMGR